MHLVNAVFTFFSDQAISKKDDINLPNIDWSKVSGDIISHGSDALTGAKQLVYAIHLLIIML